MEGPAEGLPRIKDVGGRADGGRLSGPEGLHGPVPGRRDLRPFYPPADELRLRHVGTQRRHRVDMGPRPHEVHEGLLVLPYGKGVELPRQDLRPEREADETAGPLELTRDRARIP